MSIAIVCKLCDSVVVEHADKMCAHCYYISKEIGDFYMDRLPSIQETVNIAAANLIKSISQIDEEETTMSNVAGNGDVLLVGTFKTRTVISKDVLSNQDPMVFEQGDTCLVWITGHAAARVAVGDSVIPLLTSTNPDVNFIAIDQLDWSAQIPLMAVTQRFSSLEFK